MDRDVWLWLWLNYGTQHNTQIFNHILEMFDDLEEAFEAASKRSSAAFSEVGEGVLIRLQDAASTGFMERYVSWLERHDIGVATLESPEYPSLLMQIYDPPTVLFYKGTLKSDMKLPIAVIGSRKCTAYGEEVAKTFARQLSENGATVVTGLAGGIDSIAAKGALSVTSSEYPVVGVLGCGIDVVYPKDNGKLYAEVAERGAVITEFIPKTGPKAENFPIRNRIMSGLSRGVLVIEAAERSGTSYTMGFAHEQGRDVFAVPGRLNDLNSVGTNRAIQRGEAKPVFGISDVLNEYSDSLDEIPYADNARELAFSSLSPLSQEVYMSIRIGEKTADELMECVDCSVAELNSTLTELSLSGIIKQLPGKLFACDMASTDVKLDK